MKARLVLATAALSVLTATAQEAEPAWSHSRIQHVLLISIDGMHAVDYLNCSKGIAGVNGGRPYCPNLATLGAIGANYVAASTTKPSDSFPGLTGIITGGTPRTTGVYYDVAYDRSLDAPAKTTGNGVAAGPCKAGAAPTGTTTEYEEGIDIDQSKLNGGAPNAGLTEGGIRSIDPSRLIRDPRRGCAPVYPWDFVRANSIFSVVHNAGGYTAWSDKHPSYASVAGHNTNGSTLDDFYAPEINSTVVDLPGLSTPTGLSCSSIPDPSQTGSWTDSFRNVQCYDTLKVHAILNQIHGRNHNAQPTKVPALFGMNFQAVSVGQKLIEKNVASGGYLDAAGTPSEELLGEIRFVDASIGEFIRQMKEDGVYESTLVVVTAKHGQSPIDPKRFFPIPGSNGSNGASPATLLANLLPYSESPNNPTGIGPTEDDVSLLWLKDSRTTESAVTTLEDNGEKIGLGQIFYGPSLAIDFNQPGLPPYGDPRTPDIIVTPNYGVIYTGSSKKQEEHGGFSHDDTNVVLLVANPSIVPHTVHAAVEVTQIAPTILRALSLNPQSLDAVRAEGTPVLPALSLP